MTNTSIHEIRSWGSVFILWHSGWAFFSSVSAFHFFSNWKVTQMCFLERVHVHNFWSSLKSSKKPILSTITKCRAARLLPRGQISVGVATKVCCICRVDSSIWGTVLVQYSKCIDNRPHPLGCQLLLITHKQQKVNTSNGTGSKKVGLRATQAARKLSPIFRLGV